MQNDLAPGRMMKAVQKLAGLVGIGLVSVDDPDYSDLIEAYRTISVAHRKADYTTVLTTFDRDYTLVNVNKDRIKKSEVEEQLRARFENQIKTDYREEPAHFVIRGNRAQIASRIYSNTVCRRNGKLVELQERGERSTTWVKTKSGWKRIETKIRSHEQNIEWITEAVVDDSPASRTEKFLI
jgi:hypothetical protein